MLNDNFKMIGHLSIALNGEVVAEVPNLVVNAGKAFVAERMKDDTTTAMTHMAIGTGGATAAAATQTGLTSESNRQTLTSTNVSSATITYVASFAAGQGTGAITEAGIFNASSAGDMLCRTTFSVVNKGASDSMTITWAVTVS